MRIKNTKAIGMSFTWLFAIIAGVFILFLAIYGATKFIGVGNQITSTESAAKLSALLDPAESGIASGKYSKIEFKKDTRIYFSCSERGDFGKQTIAFADKSFGKWGEPGEEIAVYNKYVFAEEVVEGDLHLFSMPFSMPFKVADIIVASSENYCFAGAGTEIENEIREMGIENIEIISVGENCDGTKVCFVSDTNCDVRVSGSLNGEGFVKKGSKELYYVDNLFYAAIMSSPDIYECNVKRLMKKFGILADVYIGKIDIIRMQGCGSNIEGDLINLKRLASDLDSSEDLSMISQASKIADLKNKNVMCRLY